MKQHATTARTHTEGRVEDRRQAIAPTMTRAVHFPHSMDDVLVLNFSQDDKCYDYVGKDENGNKIYKQVTCPWDTIVFTDDDD